MDVGQPHEGPFRIGAVSASGTDAITEQDARHMYRRTLSRWAMDLLSLRQRGIDTPRNRPGSMSTFVPAPSAGSRRAA